MPGQINYSFNVYSVVNNDVILTGTSVLKIVYYY
jgi:hypothetical protein